MRMAEIKVDGPQYGFKIVITDKSDSRNVKLFKQVFELNKTKNGVK